MKTPKISPVKVSDRSIKDMVGIVVGNSEPKHAHRSPSTLKAYEICPSWEPIPQGNQKENTAAEEGTLLHEYLEKPCKTLFEALSLDHQEMVTALEGYVDNVHQGCHPESKILREIKLDLIPFNIKGCTHGTADVVIHDPLANIAHLIDYKFGKIEVDDPETNPQIWAYALAVFNMHPKITEVQAHILQPRCDTIGTHSFTRDQMPKMIVRLQTICARASVAKPEQIPTWDNCRFCNLKEEGRCGALTKIALKTIQQNELAIVPKSIISSDHMVMQEDVKKVSVEEASILYDLANLLEGWAKSLRGAIAFRDDADEIPGHALVITNGKRTIRDPLGAREELKAYGITDEQIISIADLPISKVEKLVGDTAERGNKQKLIGEMSESLLAEGILDISNPVRYLRRTKSEETK